MKPLRKHGGFTLTEAMVSGSVIALLLGVLLSMTDQTQRLMKGTSSKVEQFRQAQVAFETVTRRLSQATLNTYLDYEYKTVTQNVAGRPKKVRVPTRYARKSDLRFLSGPMSDFSSARGKVFRPTHGVFFQAPNGYVDDADQHGVMDHLLNTWGYFVEMNTDEELIPDCLRGRVTSRKRFRLMEVTEPAERLRVYNFRQGSEWFRPLITESDRPVRVVAENIVALIILPCLAEADEEHQRQIGQSTVLAPNYRYDTLQSHSDPNLNPKHQLPPVIQVAMVAIDEPSGGNLEIDFRNQAALGLDYGKLFTDPKVLEDDPDTSTPGDGDLSKFTQMLSDRLHVSSRVFSTKVSIRGAKWSRGQEN